MRFVKNVLWSLIILDALRGVWWLKDNLGFEDTSQLIDWLSGIAIFAGAAMFWLRKDRHTWLAKTLEKSYFPNDKMGRVEQFSWHVSATLIVSVCILAGTDFWMPILEFWRNLFGRMPMPLG